MVLIFASIGSLLVGSFYKEGPADPNWLNIEALTMKSHSGQHLPSSFQLLQAFLRGSASRVTSRIQESYPNRGTYRRVSRAHHLPHYSCSIGVDNLTGDSPNQQHDLE